MKKVLSFVIFTGLFLAVGLLAFMAMPSDGASVAEAPQADVVAGQGVNAPEAPTAALNRNHIALPLDASASITPFDGQGLLDYIGNAATTVENWNSTTGSLDFWDEPSGFGIVNGVPIFAGSDYPIAVGQPYLVTVDSTADTTFTIVGDVPAIGSINFTFVGASPCTRNEIIVPLDQSSAGINNADDLIASIGNVQTVEAWNATNQNLDFWDVPSGFGLVNGVPIFSGQDFPVQLGYPYFICVEPAGNGTTWP